MTKIIKHIALLTGLLILAGCLDKTNPGVAAVDPPTPVDNTPPTISGNPQNAVMLGDNYSFTPSASDPDGDTLTFSAQNLPQWASFDTTTGRVFGQPALPDVGVYRSIRITVSDGVDTASTPAFDVTVSQTALGSMEISWSPPSQNTDGTALTDLMGFRIYYGVVEGSYSNRIDIDNVGTTMLVVDSLAPDTYYVVATSVNSLGVESEYSNVAVKVVQ